MTIKRASLLTGIFLLIAGVFIALFSYNPSPVIGYVVAICSLLAGISAIMVGSKSVDSVLSLKSQRLIGVGLIVYAIAVAFYVGDLRSFLIITSFFLLLYGVVEIIFSFGVLNQRGRPGWNVILFKVITGFVASIGAMWILIVAPEDANIALLFSGLVIFLIGVSFMMVSPYLGKPLVSKRL